MIHNLVNEIKYTFFLFIICIQYLYLYIKNYKNYLIKKDIDVIVEEIPTKLTFYTNENNISKKHIYVFDGGFNMSFTEYQKKLIEDFVKLDKDFLNKYKIFIFHKEDACSLIIYDMLSNFIISNSKECKNIIFIGFSGGGVVSSHVMTKLKDIKCSKKIITYDSPYNVVENVSLFRNYYLLRLDTIMYKIVENVYKNHYNYNKIKDIINRFKIKKPTSFFKYYNDFIELVMNVHNYNDEELLYRSTFNFKQDKNTKIVNIYSTNDPVLFYKESINFILKKCDKKDINIEFIEKKSIGHCSDFAFFNNNSSLLLNQIKK